MPHLPSDYRQAYGKVFIVETPDGIVPWVPLSLDEYFSSIRAIEKGDIAKAVIENEIFIKCVKDEVLVENIDKHKAGLVSSVVDIILQCSAPQTTDEFEFLLNIGRENINNIIHQAIMVITQAFPAYTPDDLYRLDIYSLMDRLALSERKLLENGFLKEPIAFNEPAQKKGKLNQKPKVDLSKLKQEFEQQEQPKDWNAHKRREAGDKSLNATVVEEEAPRFNSKEDEEGNTVISGQELVYNLDADPTTGSPEEQQMIQDAKVLYKEYLQKMSKGEKIKIKPHEERFQETQGVLEERRKKLQEQIAKSKKKKGAI